MGWLPPVFRKDTLGAIDDGHMNELTVGQHQVTLSLGNNDMRDLHMLATFGWNIEQGLPSAVCHLSHLFVIYLNQVSSLCKFFMES